MEVCPPTGFCALPWLSPYDPYWWRRFTVEACNADGCKAVPFPPDEQLCGISSLIGLTVLARRAEDGYYYMGHVKQEISRDRFLVLFDQATRGRSRSANLQEVWIFDIIAYSDAFRHPIVPGDKVLVHVGDSRYAPATVVQGNERRFGNPCIPNTDLLVNHIDGLTHRLGQGVAVWIPPSLFDRLCLELKLPYGARRSLAETMPPPECNFTCKMNGDCYAECGGWPVCEEDCRYVHATNPYLCSNYYRGLYSRWPWWWRWWFHQLPPPWFQRSRRVPPNTSPRPLIRSRSAANLRTSVVCDDDLAVCYPVSVIEYDPLSRKVADQITEHSRLILRARDVSPCQEPREWRTQTELMKSMAKHWKPHQPKWLPTNKNQYGMHKTNEGVNYAMQDRAVAEWNDRGRPKRPMTTYTNPPRHHHCCCEHC